MKQKILAIDDEPHMLKLLERIITEKTSYTIKTTHNSLEVQHILEQEQFDLIITDLKMPGMDGLDILQYVKEHNRTEEVIIITAFGSLDSASKALSLGVFDYITKPFKKEQIIHTIDRVMKWQRAKQSAEELERLFRCAPFEKAVQEFEKVYLRKLTDWFNGNIPKVAEISGIDESRVQEVVKE